MLETHYTRFLTRIITFFSFIFFVLYDIFIHTPENLYNNNKIIMIMIITYLGCKYTSIDVDLRSECV